MTTTGEDVTIFEILATCGRIVLGDEETGLLYTWNGSLTFQAFQHAGHGRFYAVDAWTVAELPENLDAASEKCREHLSASIADADD